MTIAIASLFRNSAHRVASYMARVQALCVHGPTYVVRVVAVEGDSTDATRSMLRSEAERRAVALEVVTCNHGGPRFGSTEAPQRLAQLSRVADAAFAAARAEDDVFVYVESDLLWDAHTIGSLADMAFRRDGGFDVFAPLVFAGEHFYDVWGYRKNGARFAPFKPYHSDLDSSHLTEVDSVGSCLAMRGAVARSCRVRHDYALVGWCEDARARGYRIAVHPEFRINHP